MDNKLIVTTTSLSTVSDGISVSTTGENISAKNSSGRKVDYYKISASDDIFIRQALSLFAWNEIVNNDNRNIDYKMTKVSLNGTDKGMFIENEQGVGKKAQESLNDLYMSDTSEEKNTIIDYLLFLQMTYAPKNISDDYFHYVDNNGNVVITPGKIEYSFNTFSGRMSYLSYNGQDRVMTLSQMGFDGDEIIFNSMSKRWTELRQGPLTTEKMLATVDSYANSIAASGYPSESGKYKSDDSFKANDYYLDAVNSFKEYLCKRLDNLDKYYALDFSEAQNADYLQSPVFERCSDKDAADLASSVEDGLPSVFITTANGTMDYINDAKGHKEPASFIAVSKDGKIDSEGKLSWIKGKGHSSFTHSDKKSYQILFDQDTDVLGMGKAAHYVLQANALDPSKIRNYVAYNFANEIGMRYSSDTTYINLYLNGEYWGCYMIIEPVEVASGRIDEKEINYLFEINNAEDERTKEGNVYFKDNYGLRYELDFPDGDVNDVGESALNEVTGVVSSNVDDIMKLSESSDKVHFEELSERINMDSFANMFIMDMIFDDVDANALSTFYYIDKDNIMNAGPVWDYDLTLGNHGEREIDRGDSSFINGMPEWLFENDDFKKLVKSKWDNQVKDIVYRYADEVMYEIADEIAEGTEPDRNRWGYEERTPDSSQEWMMRIDEASDFMKKRAELIDEMLAETED